MSKFFANVHFFLVTYLAIFITVSLWSQMARALTESEMKTLCEDEHKNVTPQTEKTTKINNCVEVKKREEAQNNSRSRGTINPDAGSPAAICGTKHDPGSTGYAECIAATKRADLQAQREYDELKSCDDLKKIHDDESKKYSETCAKAGIANNCQKTIKDCKADDTEADDSTDSLMGIFGSMMQTPTDVRVNRCAITGKDYFDRSKELKKDIDKINEDIAKKEGDLAKVDEEYEKTNQEIQEKVLQDQQDFKKYQKELKQNEREQLQQQQKEAMENTNNLQNLSRRKRQLRSDLNKYRQKAEMQLLSLENSIVHTKCMGEVQKIRAEALKSGMARQSSRGLLVDGNALKNQLQGQFNVCVAAMQKQKESVIQELQEAAEGIADDLKAVEENIAMAEQATQLQQQNRAQQMQDQQTELSERMQFEMQKLQQNQGRLTTAANLKNKKSQTYNKELADYYQRIQTKNTEINKMKPFAPSSPGGTESVETALSQYNSRARAHSNYYQKCCNKRDTKDNHKLCGSLKSGQDKPIGDEDSGNR